MSSPCKRPWTVPMSPELSFFPARGAYLAGDVRRVEHIMGMPITLALRGVHRELTDEAFGWLRWVDDTFSTYKMDSEISRLARGEVNPRHLHPLVREVLDRCAELAVPTRGYFDVYASGRLDPS